MRELNKAMEWLNQYHSKEPRLGLSRVRALAKLVGNPELKSKVIHIAGTNGKGSTVTFLSNLLQKQGLKVGVFSSPYITQYEEQFQINGQMISSEDLTRYVTKYQKVFEDNSEHADIKGITEFELITVLAYDYFADQAVDVAIMEVGLGGKEDSTNICQPILTGITTIGLDHVDILGHTFEEVARQKAGIIKDHVPIVTGRIVPEALAVIKQVAQDHHANHVLFDVDYQGDYLEANDLYHTHFTYQSERLAKTQFSVPLVGKHQVDNASMAIQLFEIYCQQAQLSYDTELIQSALDQVAWPARMEVVSKQPFILIDGAHNPHAMARLIENINSLYGEFEKELLFTCIRTKDIQSMVNDFKQIDFKQMTMTTFDHEQAFSVEELEAFNFEGLEIAPDWRAFLTDYLKQPINDRRLLLITGSLYFLSQVRPLIQQQLNKDTE